MLRELRARAFFYNAAKDVATIAIDIGGKDARTTSRAATLLLDAKGFLVGVDLEEAGNQARIVVMLGAHEAVDTTKSAQVDVDAIDEAPVAIRIANVRGVIGVAGASDANPYVRTIPN